MKFFRSKKISYFHFLLFKFPWLHFSFIRIFALLLVLILSFIFLNSLFSLKRSDLTPCISYFNFGPIFISIPRPFPAGLLPLFYCKEYICPCTSAGFRSPRTQIIFFHTPVSTVGEFTHGFFNRSSSDMTGFSFKFIVSNRHKKDNFFVVAKMETTGSPIRHETRNCIQM